MALGLKHFPGKGTFPRGVHPPGKKYYTMDLPVEVMPSPKKVVIPLLQNIGAPCEPLVKAKQAVKFGEMIAVSKAPVSAPLHSPIRGKVEKITVTSLPNGRHVPAISILAEGEQVKRQDLWNETFGGFWPKDIDNKYDPLEIKDIIYNSGIVGLGGAAFPTHIKMVPNEKKPVNTLLINGCECEPYLTSDYRLMIEAPRAIIAGALLAGCATGAKDVIVCIEDNKPEAVIEMRRAARATRIKIAGLKTKYPQGSERHMIMAIIKRIMPLGGLPGDVGVAVSNVGTAAAVAGAVLRNRPLTHRIVCVTGGGIVNPKNLLVPIGISYGDLIDYCGGLSADAARVLSGGPMMGFSFSDFDMPITKGTGGITVLTKEDVDREKETSCIRCGRCVDVCPMHLVPTRLALAARCGDMEMAEKYNIMGCMESGCCAYICPANIPLVQLIRTGKAMLAVKAKKT